MTDENESPAPVGSESPNDRIQAAICQGLGRAGHRGLRGVTVHVDHERIVLTGTVASYFLKQVAQETARHACPDRRVYNELDVTQQA